MGAEETRKRILSCTVDLIRELHGDIDGVTMRTIAQRAGVGVGLTNHYFKSKELLLRECVDTAFRDLFDVFMRTTPRDPVELLAAEEAGPLESTKRVARNVYSFFIENEALARVAFLTEGRDPELQNYTTRLVNSFAFCMVDRKKLEDILFSDKMTDNMKQQFREHMIGENRIKAFMLTATLKETFLRRDLLHDTIGVNSSDADMFGEYIDSVVETLM